jgi:hypothetical protein
MFQRFILCAISVLFLLTGAMAQNPSPKTPEHLRYYFVFRQLSLLDQKAVAAERKGEGGTKYRQHYKKFALLNDHQMSQLDQIAKECLREVAAYDARIKQVVNEARAGIRAKKLEAGTPLPEPSAELKQIGIERDRIIRRAYRRLLDALGETEFKRFNEVIEKSVRVNTAQIGGRESVSRENRTIVPVGGMVHGVSMIQEADGNVLLYTATELDYATYTYYDGGIDGLIFNANTDALLAELIVVNGPTAEVIVTIPAIQGTSYLGYGGHFLVPVIYNSAHLYYDPYCFSRACNPSTGGSEMTFTGCGSDCSVFRQVIPLGVTLGSVTTQNVQ